MHVCTSSWAHSSARFWDIFICTESDIQRAKKRYCKIFELYLTWPLVGQSNYSLTVPGLISTDRLFSQIPNIEFADQVRKTEEKKRRKNLILNFVNETITWYQHQFDITEGILPSSCGDHCECNCIVTRGGNISSYTPTWVTIQSF